MVENCPSCKVHRGHRAGCPLDAPVLTQTPGAIQTHIDPERYSLARYRDFLRAKCNLPADFGVPVEPGQVFETAVSDFKPKPHQVAAILWAVRGGRRALFESFGLGKTVQQLEIERLILKSTGGRGLIVAPLGVRQEFQRDAERLGIALHFVQRTEEVKGSVGSIFLTNYQSVRDGKLDPGLFTVVSLDEASILRSFGGTKTFREFMRLFPNTPYRFVATATPDPNEYIELLSYAAWLGIMDVSQGKTRFFKRDSTKADTLTLHPHKEKEFWLWNSSYGLFLSKPSDLGFPDDGYAIPQLEIIYHEVKVDHSTAPPEKDGQGRMFREASHGVVDASREKRDTIQERVEKVCEIIDAEPEKHFLIWHDLENERKAIEKAVPGVVSVFGAQRSKKQDLAKLEQAIIDFSEGRIQYLAAKPSMFGAGANFQYHCSDAIFCGIGFKFNDFIQAVHRIYRFLQTKTVRIHLIYAESERLILQNLLAKWERHRQQSARMSEIIREYGLSQAAMANTLARSMGVERSELATETCRLINNDSVEEIHADSETAMPADSVHLILTSIPFSTQYEYTPSYNDFGHTDGNEHFFEQMDFLTPQLYRVLKPGRVCAIHVKDRITPGGITGLGFQTVYPFHCRTIDHFIKHGFGYMGMKTIVTDVVRENGQTYRLGWTEQCKDGSKMGVGMPEYLLIFRKPPTDTTNAYADEPVVKHKPMTIDEETGETGPYDKTNKHQHILLNTGYSRARWQLDAHGFERSSGDRLLTAEELEGIAHHAIYKKFRDFSKHRVYDYEHHVAIAESLEAKKMLPVKFMLLPPQSWHPDVWTDITRMRTLNGAQSAKGKEMHLCPMQFDLANRVIAQNSMEGEIVFDPFGGLMTVPFCAVPLKRRAISCELNPAYFRDGVAYVKSAEEKANAPTLFDVTEWTPKLEEEDEELNTASLQDPDEPERVPIVTDGQQADLASEQERQP
jgi:DNA modification methylase